MFQGFFLGHQAAHFGVDIQYRFSQKEAAQFLGIIRAPIPLSANTEIHDPVVAGLIDEVLHQLGGDDGAFRGIDGGIDLNSLVFWKYIHLITTEDKMINQVPDQGQSGHPGEWSPGRVDTFE
jgi:hypothetical protein